MPPSVRFRAEREADWLRLEALLDRVERRSAAALDAEDLLALPVLYRSTVSALSVARETSLDRGLIDYLEALASRAYLLLYGVRGRLGPRVAAFFLQDWPVAARTLWRETLVAALLLVCGTAAGAALVATDPSWFATLVPNELSQGRGPDATVATLRRTLYGGGDGALELLATFLFTHNARMALTCFAFGILLSIPSAILLVVNGLTLGAFLTVFARAGLAAELVGWLGIHGTTELFAIVLAGAAGLRIGWALGFPGALSRLDAMTAAGRQAGTLMVGVVVMLFVAALLEGFARQLVHAAAARYAVAAAMLVLWLVYLYAPRREPAP